MHLTLTPAYGRDYKSRKAAMGDFLAGKDFISQPAGRYASLRDLPIGTTINLRYKQMREVFPFTITQEMKDGQA